MAENTEAILLRQNRVHGVGLLVGNDKSTGGEERILIVASSSSILQSYSLSPKP